MCFAVTCQTCNKQTWQGCGKHVESVMSKIPVEDRCTCKRDDNKKPGTPIVTIMIGLLFIYWWLNW
ncbi:11622_t:CDS:2 [Rhizophagus irregularis]|uniref:Uncharacterized protein n=1 Tax=Rhizophagus irregularis (strain DAOM 181602 / DAOM 197198 / MUCL 43194) TaxID=747089 RepID=U9TXT6_RHIID|nr:11622_t:CDS:2 [Rhizophagus irregularis]